MRNFTDCKNDEWTIAITVGTLDRVERELGGFKLCDIFADEMKTLVKIFDEYSFLGAVLHAVLLPEIERRNLTPEAFADRLAGDCLETAAHALVDAVIDFLPEKKRTTAAALMLRLRKADATLYEKIPRLTLAKLDARLAEMSDDDWLASLKN